MMGAISKLHEDTYQQIRYKFPEFTIRENIRPDWLISSQITRLEIDIFIEDINTAIEIQGIQHFEFTPYFHKTYDDFRAQQERDEEKMDLCIGKGVKLVEIACYADLKSFIYDLEERKRISESVNAPFVYNTKLRKSLMNSEKYRRYKARMRRKAREKEYRLAHPYEPKKPKPGNQRQRRYAKYILKCAQLNNGEWMVYGGRDKHIVRDVGGVKECDCAHSVATGRICSHVLKITQHEWDN